MRSKDEETEQEDTPLEGEFEMGVLSGLEVQTGLAKVRSSGSIYGGGPSTVVFPLVGGDLRVFGRNMSRGPMTDK